MHFDQETYRLAALREYDVLDTPKEDDFDKITAMGARLFDVGLTCITLVDNDRFFFKSMYGADVTNMDRRPGFCDTTIQQEGVYCVEDTTANPLLSDHPLVCDEPHIRSYAGSPLITSDGYAIGTICVMDSKKRVFSEAEKSLLHELAEFVMFQLDKRRLKAVEEHREQSRQDQQKLESLGMLAGGIAHDFNNLLVGVLGNASLASHQVDQDGAAQESISNIIHAADQASELTDQLLAYAGQRPSRAQPVDLAQLLGNMDPLLRSSKAACITLNIEIDEGLPAAIGDPTQLRQVILNLVTNAGDAYEGKPGTINIGISLADKSTEKSSTVELSEGRYVCIRIEDFGVGMDDKTLKSIFSPFFSTKVSGRGLGMSIVQRIVRAHGGHIEVDSTLGEGCTVRVLLPADQSQVAHESRACMDQSGLISGNGTVLVVDDDALVINMTRSAVKMLGFEVLTAKSGSEALQRVQSGNKVSVILLDATMQDMNGAQTLREIKRHCPDVPTIVTSGHHIDEVAEMFDDFEQLAFLHKPWKIAELSDVLRTALL